MHFKMNNNNNYNSNNDDDDDDMHAINEVLIPT